MNLQNDISLLILKEKVELNSYVKLACLPEKEGKTLPEPNLPAWIVGWVMLQKQCFSHFSVPYFLILKFYFKGATETSTGSSTLKNVQITTYNSSMCRAVLTQMPKKWDAQVCAGISTNAFFLILQVINLNFLSCNCIHQVIMLAIKILAKVNKKYFLSEIM